jgi:hypothetical protein
MPPSTELPAWLRHAGGSNRRGGGDRRPGRGQGQGKGKGTIAALAILLFAAGGGGGYLLALRRMPQVTAPAAPPVCAPALDCVAPATHVAPGGGIAALPSHAARRGKSANVSPTPLLPLPERKPLDEGERTRALRAFAANRAPELRDCLDEPDQGPARQLGAAFEIGANGAVELVQILGADAASTEVRRCYSSHLKKWRFPQALLRGEEKLLVNFVL